MRRHLSLCIFAEDHDNELLSALPEHCCGHARFVRFSRVCDAYLESSCESAEIWCRHLHAKITGSMDTDYPMLFKAVFGHLYDVRARPDLHNVMPFEIRITFQRHVPGCSLSKFRDDPSMWRDHVLSQNSEMIPPCGGIRLCRVLHCAVTCACVYRNLQFCRWLKGTASSSYMCVCLS